MLDSFSNHTPVWWEELRGHDYRYKKLDSQIEELIKPSHYTGLVISLPNDLTLEVFLDRLYTTFSLDEECLFFKQCYNTLGEECILMVDKLQLGFARYVFDHWEVLKRPNLQNHLVLR